MDVFNLDDYRDILRHELSRRIKQNPRYSQGAFARDLDLTPGRLSEILHAKQGLSSRVALQIVKRLRFTESEGAYFLDLVESMHGRSQMRRENARVRLLRYRKQNSLSDLGEDIFRSIADWHHMAILELLHMERGPKDAKGLADALRIDVGETEAALQRLTRLQLIGSGGRGVHYARPVESENHSEAFQKFARQILSKAIEAVDESHAFSAHNYMLALDEAALAEVQQLVKSKADRLAAHIANEEGDKSALYCLSLQFFPVLARETVASSDRH